MEASRIQVVYLLDLYLRIFRLRFEANGCLEMRQIIGIEVLINFAFKKVFGSTGNEVALS